jgi:hypothetical protein
MTKLSFEMALANMKRGKMVRRASLHIIAYTIKDCWINAWQLVRESGGERWECINIMGAFFSAVDILAEDWEVVEL